MFSSVGGISFKDLERLLMKGNEHSENLPALARAPCRSGLSLQLFQNNSVLAYWGWVPVKGRSEGQPVPGAGWVQRAERVGLMSSEERLISKIKSRSNAQGPSPAPTAAALFSMEQESAAPQQAPHCPISCTRLQTASTTHLTDTEQWGKCGQRHGQ